MKIPGGYRLFNDFGNLMIDIVILEDCMIVYDPFICYLFFNVVAYRRGTFVGM